MMIFSSWNSYAGVAALTTNIVPNIILPDTITRRTYQLRDRLDFRPRVDDASIADGNTSAGAAST